MSLHALLIGVGHYFRNRLPDGHSSYSSLYGAVRDIERVEQYLLQDVKLEPERIRKLTITPSWEETPPEPPEVWPTYENMVRAFQRLADEAFPGDEVYIHYSGHGGRTPTLLPGIKESPLDEALVPCDIGQPSARYLRDVELASILQDLVERDLIVTVVLDCCHAAGADRGKKGAVKRGLSAIDATPRPGESLVATRDELVRTWQRLGSRTPKVATRSVSVKSWLPSPDGYVLFAACRPSESAFEYPFEGGEPQGALTYRLLETLRSDGPHASCKRIQDRLEAKIPEDFQRQTPMLLGDGDRAFLGNGRTESRFAVNVLRVEPGRVRLSAGRSQGVSAGSRFAVYPRQGPEQGRPRPTVVEVEAPEATETWARIVRAGLAASTSKRIEPGDQAVFLRPGRMLLQSAVRLVPQDLPRRIDQDVAFARVRSALEGDESGFVRLAEGGEIFHFQVAVTGEGEYEIRDAEGGKVPHVQPPLSIRDPRAARELVRRLAHLTRFRNVRNLESAGEPDKLRFEVVGKEVIREAEHSVGRVDLRLGESLSLRIVNSSRYVLNVAVLDLQPDWGIAQVYPGRNEGAFWPFDPGEEKTFHIPRRPAGRLARGDRPPQGHRHSGYPGLPLAGASAHRPCVCAAGPARPTADPARPALRLPRRHCPGDPASEPIHIHRRGVVDRTVGGAGAAVSRDDLDFDLLIEPAGEGYRALVLDSGEKSTFPLEFARLKLAGARRAVLRGDRRHLKAAAEEEWNLPRKLGGELFRAVFAGPVLHAFQVRRAEAAASGKKLRLRLRLEARDLVILPWEILYDPNEEEFVALSSDISIVRFLSIRKESRPLLAEPPLRILAVIANPGGGDRLDVEREWRELQEALSGLEASGRLQLERLLHPTLPALSHYLRHETCHVLHFIGHGAYEIQRQGGVLVLEDDQGKWIAIGHRHLGVFLEHKPLRLVVLNACEGARTSPADPFSGVAQTLVRKGIPAVLAMQCEVTDAMAIAFAGHFYQALSESGSLDRALTEARRDLLADGFSRDWAAPVLYLRAPDGQILPPPPPRPRPVLLIILAILVASLAVWLYHSKLAKPYPQRRAEDNPRECPSPPGLDMAFVQVEPGTFPMGEKDKHDSQPTRMVIIRTAFCMGVFEVTRAQWAEVMGGAPVAPSEAFLPVGGVTWEEAHLFLSKLNQREGRSVYRLPTEEEWEYAVRAGSATRYYFGNDFLGGHGNCSGRKINDRYDGPAPVGTFQSNPLSLHDMYGNVWEWVEGGTEEGTGKRVRRGGSWNSRPENCSSAHRSSVLASRQYEDNGLRIVREIQ